jgi:hypothetical protein
MAESVRDFAPTRSIDGRVRFEKEYSYKAFSDKIEIEKKVSAIDISGHEGDYYLSGLFNIETSPGFRALDNLRNRRDFSEERLGNSLIQNFNTQE